MIFCIGFNLAVDKTLIVPRLALNSHVEAKVESIQPAGKAVNVSRILGYLGSPVRLFALVGVEDQVAFSKSFDGLCVETHFFPFSGRTRTNTTLIDPVNLTETHLREEGPEITPHLYAELICSLLDQVRAGDWVVFSGSLPPGIAVCEVLSLIGQLKRSGIKVAIDASGDLIRAIPGHSIDLLKPNRLELSTMYGRPIVNRAELLRSAEEAATAFKGRLLVSDGEMGSGLFGCGSSLWAEAIYSPRARTVGAGDALLAGFLSGIDSGLSDGDSLRLAVATAGDSVSQPKPGVVSCEGVRFSVRNVVLHNLHAE